MTGVGLRLYIILLALYEVADAQTYTVTIVSEPAGKPVDGHPNTFEYPILSSVILTCVVNASDNSHFKVSSFHWNTKGCYNNSGYHRGKPRCFPHDQKTQRVVGVDLTAKDAGTISCAATIKYRKHYSSSFTIRISGVTLTGGRESTGFDVVTEFNIIKDYSPINPKNNGLLFRCVSGLGPTSRNNSEFGELYFGRTIISSGECDGPAIQPRGATIGNYVGIINVFLCKEFTPSNEGVYNCTMKNSSMAKESVRVGVYFSNRIAPIVTTPSNVIIGTPGDPLNLTCISERSPPDTFTWMKDGIPILKNITTVSVAYTKTIAVFQSNYSIANFSTNDIGNYTCSITNPLGSASKEITVNPYFKNKKHSGNNLSTAETVAIGLGGVGITLLVILLLFIGRCVYRWRRGDYQNINNQQPVEVQDHHE
ncbi:cell adhesion molecule DSCAML1-like isoform X2 [Dysidea avara]|uniref:cell adhesion molecule DSCAML1-like isoform X2 n=1 Tax=Dysidea avara TaxID=196820 RepID=UPI00332C12EF